MGSNQSTGRQHAPEHKAAPLPAETLEQAKGFVTGFIDWAPPGSTYKINWSRLNPDDRARLLTWIAELNGTCFKSSYLKNVKAVDPAERGAKIGTGVGAAGGAVVGGLVAATLFMFGVGVPVVGWLFGGLFVVGACAGAVAGNKIARSLKYDWVTIETEGDAIKCTRGEAAERA